MQTRMGNLARISLLSITFLGGAVSAGAVEGTLPSRPVLPRDTGIAPPTRIPDAEPVTPTHAGTRIGVSLVPRPVRRAVVEDAAKRFGVAPSAVVLTGAEQVTWSDGSLGCAEPGVMYTQNLVPGFRITAKTAAGELVYHTDARGFAKSCGPTPRSDAPATPPRKVSDKTPVRGAGSAPDR